MAVKSEHHIPLLHPPGEVVQQQECLQTNCIHMKLTSKKLYLSYSQHKCIHKVEMCIYNRKMQALLAQEIQPFLTKPTQW
jgi:hypothetical protein